MFDDKDEEKQQFRSGIRRLIGSEDNARYLRSLPEFRVESQLPAKLRSLLRTIDQTERKRSIRRT
jgi:hypothetical protein